MSQPQLLLVVILLQQSLFAAVWLIAAVLRLARRAALHWAAATMAVAGGLGLVLGRGTLSPWLSLVLANVLIVAGVVLLRRGVQVFTRTPMTDLEQAAVLLAATLGLAGVVTDGGSLRQVAITGSSALAWTLLRMAWEMWRALGREFGAAAARWCALPAAAIGVLFAARAISVLAFAGTDYRSFAEPSSQNVAVTLGMLTFGLVVNMMLVAITVVRLVQRLRHQSEHDVLTGRLNRRAMQQLLAQQAQRRRRFGEDYAILSLDIDHFKRINDAHGHAAGDAVLVAVAQALVEACREVDRVARTGGEEFCVLLPGSDAAGAERTAQRLRRAVAALDLDAVAPGLQVTVSIGVVSAVGADEPLDDLLRRLDHALYAAKNNGRDRVEHAAAPPRTQPA